MRVLLLVGLIALCCSLASAQDRCVESGELPSLVEVLPKADVSYAEQLLRLASNYTPGQLGLTEGDVLTFSCMVNCRGEAFDFKVGGLKNEKYRAELNRLYQDMDWEPAYDKGAAVDCLGTSYYRIEQGAFKISMRRRG